MNISKKVLFFICSFLILILIFFGLNYILTLEVDNSVKNAFLSDGKYNNNISNNMTEEIYFNINRDRYYKNINRKKLKLFKILAITDFFNSGIIRMNYTFAAFNKYNELIYGSSDVPITLHIKLVNGHWKIIKKDEAP